MMDHLTPLVDKAVDLEYKTTSVDHSPVFINSHEGFGVLSEEIQEALDDLDYIAERMQDMLVAIREPDSTPSLTARTACTTGRRMPPASASRLPLWHTR